MAKYEETASFHLTLFTVYKRTDRHPEPTFLYTNREGESQCLPFLQAEEDNRKAVKSALHRLQPLARRIFSADRHVFRTVPKELADELRTVWHLGNDNLPVRFTGAGGISLEEDYLLLYLEVEPHLPVIDADLLAETSVTLCNRLSYAGQLHGSEKKINIPKNSLLTRVFPDSNAEQVSRRHFQENADDQPLIKGLFGETMTVEDIFATLAGPGWQSLLGDRFLLNSLLVTPAENEIPEHSREEQDDLVRRARGMSSSYLPPSLEDLAGHVIPVRTFNNVLFMAANEGVAGHVKPGPGPQQDFLRNQFSARYRTEYRLLFVLAVYQHYRLAAMLYKCVQGIEKQSGEEQSSEGQGSGIEQLRRLRKELVLHELKYINTQPTFLTNYQQYYCGLRQGLHTEALAVKLRRTLTELDILLSGEEQQAAEKEQQVKKEQKRRDENAKMILAMIAEAFALPYYLYSFLVHAFHLKEDGLCIWMALGFTVLVTWAVVSNTWRVMNGKKPWGFLQRFFTGSRTQV